MTSLFPAAIELANLDGTDGFVLNGIDADDSSGYSVSYAGDVNGDGIDDIIIGANCADPDSKAQAGESYVVFGGENVGSSGSIELSSLNGENGFVLKGIDADDSSGYSVSYAGDVNGDGTDDIIIGAHGADPDSKGEAGESYVVFGGTNVGSSGSIELSSLDGANGFVLNGIDAGDNSGYSVSYAGDVNGDGMDDIIIGAWYADPDSKGEAGESYVVFGGSNVGSSGSIELSDLDGTNGFVLKGIDASDYSGRSVSYAGDVNGDGIDDIIIGANWADPDSKAQAGESYVVFGGENVGSSGSIELSSLNGANGFVLNGINASDYSGLVSYAGDVNNDGVDDIIIGAYYADPDSKAEAGESYIVFGGENVGSSGSIELSSLNGANGFVLKGIDVSDYSGHSVSYAGDVNGDGIDDIIIGAIWADPNSQSMAGESYVIFGGENVGSSGLIELSNLNGANGFVLKGIDVNDWSGFSVSYAGDVNGDGIDDIIIGAIYADPDSKSNAGESYIVFGQKENHAPVVNKPMTDQTVEINKEFSFLVPEDTFIDIDNDTLTLSAKRFDGGELPDWMQFDAPKKEFTGKGPYIVTNRYTLFAQDPKLAQANTSFALTVAEQSSNGTPYADIIIKSVCGSLAGAVFLGGLKYVYSDIKNKRGRKQYPFADTLRSELRLAGISNFNSAKGTGYLRIMGTLEKKLKDNHLLWRGMPDDDLKQLAKDVAISTKTIINSQVSFWGYGKSNITAADIQRKMGEIVKETVAVKGTKQLDPLDESVILTYDDRSDNTLASSTELDTINIAPM